jgi:hypothetical protein
MITAYFGNTNYDFYSYDDYVEACEIWNGIPEEISDPYIKQDEFETSCENAGLDFNLSMFD